MTANDIVNGTFRDTVLSNDLGDGSRSRFEFLPNTPNVIFGDYCSRIGLARKDKLAAVGPRVFAPYSIAKNKMDILETETVFTGKLEHAQALRLASSADFVCDFDSYFRLRVRFARHSLCAALSVHVANVISGGPLKEVARIAARRVIASMADQQRRPLAVVQKICDAMGLKASPFTAAKVKVSIAASDAAPLPFPAIGKALSVYFRPKSFNVLLSKLRRVSIWCSHNLNYPFRLWTGRVGVSRTCAGRSETHLNYTTASLTFNSHNLTGYCGA